MNIQTHHIKYEPEWTVDLPGYLHRALSIVQRTQPTEERYALLVNFLHAITFEFNRYREFLDTEDKKEEKKTDGT